MAQEGEHLRRGVGVQVAGRLVGEDELGPGDERAGAGDALLLAARQLGGAMVQAVGDAELSHQLREPRLVHRRARQVGRQGDVLRGGQRGDEIERLEHEPDPVAPQLRQLGVPERPDLLLADEGVPRGRRVQPRQAVHQRRLPRSRRPHHRGEAPPFKPDS